MLQQQRILKMYTQWNKPVTGQILQDQLKCLEWVNSYREKAGWTLSGVRVMWEWGVLFNSYRASVRGDEKVLMAIVVGNCKYN